MRNKNIITILLIFALFISACELTNFTKSKEDEGVQITGTEGLILEFLDKSPPSKIVVGNAPEPLRVTAVVRNKGAYHFTTPDDNPAKGSVIGNIYLSGYDPSILVFDAATKGTKGTGWDSVTVTDYTQNFNGRSLNGRSYQNRVGGFDYIEFDGGIDNKRIPLQPYTPILSLTACYNYETHANAQICIDHEPYKTITKKTCTIKPISLTSQGAPIAVTGIEQEVLSDKFRFKITIKNVGGGDVINNYKDNAHDTTICNPRDSKLERENFDFVAIDSIFILDKDLLKTTGADCDPLTATDGKKYLRLIDGEAFLICSLPKTVLSKQAQGYTTPMKIDLSYAYRTSIQKQIEIVKLEEDTPPAAPSTPLDSP